MKIAKNIKGLAQNYVETDWGIQQYGVAAKVFDVGEEFPDLEGPMWLEMEWAKKVVPTRFKSITGVTIKEVDEYLRFLDHRDNPRNSWGVKSISDELKTKMENNEWMTDLYSFIRDYDMVYPGDFTRMSTYGEVMRDASPSIVLVDFGFTKSVHYEYYKIN